MSVALKVEKLMFLFGQWETAEKCFTRYPFGYNWNNRTELTPDEKQVAFENKSREFVSFNPKHVARQLQFYTPSIKNDRELLAHMVDVELQNPRCALIINYGQEQEFKEALICDRGLNEK